MHKMLLSMVWMGDQLLAAHLALKRTYALCPVLRANHLIQIDGYLLCPYIVLGWFFYIRVCRYIEFVKAYQLKAWQDQKNLADFWFGNYERIRNEA